MHHLDQTHQKNTSKNEGKVLLIKKLSFLKKYRIGTLKQEKKEIIICQTCHIQESRFFSVFRL